LTVAFAFQPNNTRWLTPAERRLAQVRLAEDAGEADQDSAEDSYASLSIMHGGLLNSSSIIKGFKMAIKDPKVLIFMLMCCSELFGLSFINFFPT